LPRLVCLVVSQADGLTNLAFSQAEGLTTSAFF
jgi:hypothetical protein